MIEHRSPISGIAAFRDRWVATAGYDDQVILWDARTKSPVARGFHDHLANQCAFSPDGRFLATASSDYSARLWSVPELRLEVVYKHHRDDVEMVAFHPSRPLLATACRDCAVRIFDLEGDLVAELRGHEKDVNSVDWVEDRDEVISSSDDGTLRRWSARERSQVEVIDLSGVQIDTVAVSPRGRIYAGTDDGEIIVAGGGRVDRVKVHEAGIKRLILDSVSGRLLSMSYDRTFRLWNIGAGGAPALELAADIPPVVWSRSSTFLGRDRIAFATFGTSYAVFDLASRTLDTSGVEPTWGYNAVAVFRGKTYAIGDAGVLFADGERARELGSLCNFLMPFGEVLLTGGQLGVIFDALEGRVVHQHRSPLNCAAVWGSGRERRAIVGSYTGEALVLRAGSGGIELERTVKLHDNAIKGIAAGREVIFSVCATGAGAFHAAATLEPRSTVAVAHEKIANGCVALGGDLFASVGRDLRLRIWQDGQATTYETPHRHSIKCVAASASGAWIATGAYDGTIALFELGARRWGRTVRPTASGISSLWADGERFLASSYDGRVYPVDLELAR
jgi:WD40 repeat protein